VSDPIPLLDLKAQIASIRSELDAAVAEIFDTGAFVLGKNVEAFEEQFAKATGAAHAIGVNSGTDALTLPLTALRRTRGPGSVVTTPFTFFATAESVLQAGLELRFADIEDETFNLDPAAAAAAAGSDTVAVLPVHLFGACADIDALRIGDAAILEDAAQAIGATYKGKKAGSLGLAAAFSFYPTKNLGAAGDAGAITTNDEEFRDRMRSLRAHGEKRSEGARTYHYEEIGFNSRLDGIQAAVLRVKLKHLPAWQERRASNAAFYDEALSGIDGVRPPARAAFGEHVYHQYAIRSDRRDDLVAHLREQSIGTCVFYPEPLHRSPALAHLGFKEGQFPVAERASREVMSLPVHESLTEAQRDRIVSTIRTFFGAA